MLALKSFINHALFIENAKDQTAVFGELSSESASYARDVGQYTSAASDKVTLHSFICKEDGVPQTVPTALVDHVLAVSKFLFDQTLNNSGEQFADVLMAQLMSKFAATADTFDCGVILPDSSSTYYMPEWVSWKAKNIAGVGDNVLRVWFADASFRLQYDEYELIVIPPMDSLDDFFKTGTEVETILKAFTTSQIVQRMQDAKGSVPETIMRSVSFDYVDPYLATHKVPSSWGLLIYGAAGNNVDIISDTLVDYILANSTHTRAEWVPILPDLFKRTEVIMVPTWYQYSVSPRLTTPAGVYSPVIGLTETLNRFKAMVNTYPEAHIIAHLQAMGHPYGSLTLSVCGGPDNRDAKYQFTDFYPDYMSVATGSQDFNRMSTATKDFLTKLDALLIAAEKMTEFSSVPAGMTRTKRNGFIYAVINVSNVNFLMAVKSNFA